MNNNGKHIAPPRLAQRLLRWFLKEELAEEVEGDLEEKFYQTLHHDSKARAKRNYWYQVLHYIRPFALKKYRSNHSNNIAMFKHNLLISFRSFRRYKSTFLINLFGLATGLATVLLIYLWVDSELKTGQFREKYSDRHYQIMRNIPLSTGIQTKETSPGPLAKALTEEFPEVAYAFSITTIASEGVLSFENEHARAMPKFAGEGYLNVFGCDLISGSKEPASSGMNHVLISEKLANQLFKAPDLAPGKTVTFKGDEINDPFIVSGVFRPVSDPSQQFDILFSYDYFIAKFPAMDEWYNGGVQSHLVLNPEADIHQFNDKIKNFLDTKQPNNTHTLFAQKYSDRYLYGTYENGIPVAGRVTYVRIFSLIAVFILVIACINYMNLSTAQASRRVKEIGVKKAIGVQRKSLIHQYFGESVFMSLLALVLAVGMALLLLPQFNLITGKELDLSQASGIALPVLLITLLTGLVSGIYPGLYLSGFKPVLALKGKISAGSGALWLRKGLVVFQFAVSVVLILAVIVIYRQIDFVQTSNLGYNNENIVSFHKEGKLAGDPSTFVAEAEKFPGVLDLSSMAGSLPGKIGGRWNLGWDGQLPEEKKVRFVFMHGDYGLAELLGITLKEGRFFSKEFPTDNKAIILNQAALDIIGYEDPLGKTMDINGPRQIVGVVENFHFEGMHHEIKPLIIQLYGGGTTFVAKIGSEDQPETISKLEELYTSLNPGYPFEYKFLDQNYQHLYDEERRIATLSNYFAGIAIAISCLGLLALTAFSTQRRFKEIAIRKVLGSGSLGIIRLFSKEFIVLIVFSIIIALPTGFYLMSSWLDGFAYRINLDPAFFLVAGMLIMAVAWLTIMVQTARSARVNVTESLRSE